MSLTDSSLINSNRSIPTHHNPRIGTRPTMWLDITSSKTDWPTPKSDDHVSGHTHGIPPVHYLNTLCLHCQQVYNPVQYMLNCSAHPMYRRRIKGHLFPEAALLIRKSTFLPDMITPLLLKDNTFNNKHRTEGNARWLCPIGHSQGSLPQTSTRQDTAQTTTWRLRTYGTSICIVEIGNI